MLVAPQITCSILVLRRSSKVLPSSSTFFDEFEVLFCCVNRGRRFLKLRLCLLASHAQQINFLRISSEIFEGCQSPGRHPMSTDVDAGGGVTEVCRCVRRTHGGAGGG